MGSLYVCLGQCLPNFIKIGRKIFFDRGSDRGTPALGCELPREGLTLWGGIRRSWGYRISETKGDRVTKLCRYTARVTRIVPIEFHKDRMKNNFGSESQVQHLGDSAAGFPRTGSLSGVRVGGREGCAISVTIPHTNFKLCG